MLLTLAACDRPSPDNGGGRSTLSAADSAVRAQPGYIVDSIHPPEEALRRFRAGLDTVRELDGPRTRDNLVRQFVVAVRSGDRAALERLVVTRAEFAFLLYPDLPSSRPPYRQPPEIAWLLLEASNSSATSKLMSRRAQLELLGHECPEPPEREGALRLQKGCVVTTRDAGSERRMRLFGTIVERNGRWKFLGLEGDL